MTIIGRIGNYDMILAYEGEYFQLNFDLIWLRATAVNTETSFKKTYTSKLMFYVYSTYPFFIQNIKDKIYVTFCHRNNYIQIR